MTIVFGDGSFDFFPEGDRCVLRGGRLICLANDGKVLAEYVPAMVLIYSKDADLAERMVRALRQQPEHALPT